MNDSARIRVLPDHVINKIAAGEVVERPASALKELLENALDAGATQIDVEIAEGGRSLVRVADNGAGMRRDDALLAVERHATSKISDVDDIENIHTLGFRGEALAAISSVSRFRLCTRPASDLSGTEITMAGGKMQDVRETGCAPGAVLEVRNLFFNVPARRKFLRTASTETDHIRRTFITVALSRPGTGFTLTIDRRRIYTLPAAAALPERLRELFPGMPLENLRVVSHARGGINVAGHVGLPALSRGDRTEQYVFINGRPAGAPVLFAALRAAYHGLLPPDRHPVLFLFLTMEAGQVDVNVHPTKKEVRFRDAGLVRAAVTAAIIEALAAPAGALKPSGAPAAPDGAHPASAAPPVLPAMDQFLRAMQTRPGCSGMGGGGADMAGGRRRAIEAPLSAIGAASCPGASVAGAPAAAGDAPARLWSWYRMLGFVGGRYAVLETADGLALLDPHAAHERVLYERFRREYQARGAVAQPLLGAATVELTPVDAARTRRYLDVLRRMGFGIAEFGGATFMIDALPACLESGDPAALLSDIVAHLDDPGGGRMPAEEHIMRAACHAAVKAARPLDETQIDALLEQLVRAEMPYTCPHGRPTLIHISLQELNRKFGRE